MATSEVQICSNALLLLGADTINSFDDASDRAKLVSNLWPNAMDAILRLHPWNCAIKREQLAADAETPDFDYAYQYTLPADCLRILQIGELGGPVDYKIEGRKVLTDEALLRIVYVYRNEDIPNWDALLVQTAEAYMAATCAYPITKSASMVEAMETLLKMKLQQARTVDGMETPPEEFGDYPLLNVRY